VKGLIRSIQSIFLLYYHFYKAPIGFYLSTKFMNGLRLGFSEFEVKVFDKRIVCAESIHSILLSFFLHTVDGF